MAPSSAAACRWPWGANTITATATDVNGNSVNRQITVTRVAITGPRMTLISGDGQTARVHEKLAAPIVVRITNPDGTAFPGKVVTFDVTRSDGRLSATGQFGDPSRLLLQATTDADGYAAAYWTLGGDAGCGNNRVSVTSRDIAGTTFFCASANPSPPRQINIGSGNNQRAEAGGPAPESLRAWVSDSCNGANNIHVTFTVTEGGGKVNGLDSVTVNTSTTGHAEVKFTLGPDAGNNTIEANFTGNTGSPATFIAYGVVRDLTKPTTFTGLVLDNTSQPLGGAFCSLTVGGQTFTTLRDLQGRFRFDSAMLDPPVASIPSGVADFTVNGLNVTSIGGVYVQPNSFPGLSYTPTLIPNAENSLATPVLLPRLNPNNTKFYDGTTDLVLTCEGIAGLKITIKANSMRKPDGTLVTPTNTTIVSLNQVHTDSVPMPIPDGASPPFAWTLQPARATFDPPIALEYPNMSGLPAGAIAYFLTYNHDTEKFEIFASGHVTNDGSTILSDPGAGLRVSGWGCNCPPYSVTGDCDKCADGTSGVVGKEFGSFKDIDIYPKHVFNPVSLCGLTRFFWFKEASCQCDPATGQKKTVAAAKVGGEVNDKWYADWIKDAPDIAFVTGHENRHVAVARNFYDTVAAMAAEIDGKRYPTETACSAAVAAFNAAYAKAEKTREVEQAAVDTNADAEQRAALFLKYQPKPSARQIATVPQDFADVNGSPEWTISLGGQAVVAASSSSFHLANVSAPDQFGAGGPGTPPDFISDDFVRLIGVRTVDGKAQYFFSEFFRIGRGNTFTIENLTSTDMPPRKPDMLMVVPDAATLTGALGQATQARVTATFADQTTGDVTPATSWTSYRTSNVGVATVDADGRVTSTGPGIAYITAVNEGTTAVARITAVPGDSLTTVGGFLRRPDGSAAVGAVVTIAGLELSAVVGADGSFSFSNVPTTLGNLTLSAVLIEGGGRLVAVAKSLSPVPGGLVDAGILTLAPFASGATTKAIAAGYFHTFALKTDGSLWAWGSGELGDGAYADAELSPVRIGTGNEWVEIAASEFHTVARKSDGSLWAWGDNSFGQLGDGTTGGKLSPVRIGAGNDWGEIAAGTSHTAARKTDGSLWAWGNNFSGQLGDGTTDGKLSPVRIGTGNDWAETAAGESHTVARRIDGSLWAWGNNESGRLGDGTIDDKLSPVRIGTGNDWAEVSAGSNHTVARKTDGSLWAWGNNDFGQLGVGTGGEKLSPVRIDTGNGWAEIAAAYDHTVARQTDGSLWAWGLNEYGKLGVD